MARDLGTKYQLPLHKLGEYKLSNQLKIYGE